MKQFESIDFDFIQCKKELAEYKTFLQENDELSEGKEILPFFKKRKQLTALLGMFSADIIEFDKIAYEFSLFGDFTCDIIIGDSSEHAYCLVEFEDAKKNSVFTNKINRSTPEWSRRFEHGFSQIVDWFWLLDDQKNTSKFRTMFGSDYIKFVGLLIIGRSEHVEDSNRFEWRRDRVIINSRKVHCYTFDDVLTILEKKLKQYQLPLK